MDIYICGSYIGNLIFGIFFNSAAIYITYKLSSEKYISQINSLIIIQFIVGILASIISSIFGVTLFIYNGYLNIGFLFLTWIPSSFILHKIILLTTCIILYLTITFPVGVLVIRCIILCKNIKVTRFKLFLIILCCFMLSLLIGHNSYTIFSEELPNDTFKKFLNDSSLTSDLFFNDIIVLGSKITFENWKFSILESLIYLILIFIITFIAIFNYIRHMKSISSSMSKGTKKLHTDFIKIVLLQSSIPYFLIFPAVITYLIFILFGNIHNIFFLGDIIVKLFCIVPTINAILFIFLPRRNRMIFFLIFTDLRNICLCISKKDNDKDNVFGSVDNLSKYFIKKKSKILKYNKEATGRVRALSVAYIE